MQETVMGRREFMKVGAGIGAAVLANQALPSFAWADVRPIGLAECVALSPAEMAERSQVVQNAWQYLQQAVSGISKADIRSTVQQMLAHSQPTFAEELTGTKKQEVYKALSTQALLEPVAQDEFLPPLATEGQPLQAFFSAPGSGYASHHAYPGGVVTHTALNVKMSLALAKHYQEVYGYVLDADVVIASQVLHDILKNWVFPWQADGTLRVEGKIAGTGEHHIYSVAESMFQGLPAEICVAQACAHDHPGKAETEEAVVGWLRAAAILIGVDPVTKGYLAADGKSLPQPRRMENFVCHLGDHDFVLAAPVVGWLMPELRRIAQKSYGMGGDDLTGKQFNTFRNYVFSQYSAMYLYQHYRTGGAAALEEQLTRLVQPA